MQNITKRMRIKHDISDDVKSKLDSIVYTEDEIDLLRSYIRSYLERDYSLEILSTNWTEIKKLGRDSSSLRSYILRYGEKIGRELFNRKTAKSIQTKEDYIKKYGEKVAKEKLRARGASLEIYQERYGKTEGLKRWERYCEKRAKTFEQGRKENRYASRNLEWYQNKYGEEKGYKVWDGRRKKQAYKVSKQWYIDTYGEEEGTIRCRNTKARDLNFFVTKYGKEDGERKHKQMIEKILAAGNRGRPYSMWAMECCREIKKTIKDLHYYGKNEIMWKMPIEFQLEVGQTYVKPDLFYNGKIIEFQGDVFHGNPLLFEKNETPHPYNSLTVQELNNKDMKKFEYYRSKGYDIIEVWETEYYTNKKEVIEKCLMYLK